MVLPPGTGGTSTLDVLMVDEDDRPVSGRASWVSSRDPTFLAEGLLGGSPSSKDESKRVRLPRGRNSLAIPAGHWVWLRFSGRTQASGEVFSFRKVAPFLGRRTLTVRFRSSKRGIHVFLLEDDLRGPAAGKRVSLHSSDRRLGGPPRLLRTIPTDAGGYALFDELEPGLYSVCAPDTRVGEAPPRTARLVLPQGMPTLEVVVNLVAPEARCLVVLKVDPRFRAPPRTTLYLRRTGDLVANQKRTRLRLLGLQHEDFPVTLTPVPAEGGVDLEPGIRYLGPFRWRTAEREVPVLPGPVRLAALGRTGCWISRDLIRLDEPGVEAAFLPATPWEIRWKKDLRSVKGTPRLELESKAGTWRTTLLPRLRRLRGRMQGVLVGSLLAPRGRVEMRILGQDGTLLRRPVLEADRPFQAVEVGG